MAAGALVVVAAMAGCSSAESQPDPRSAPSTRAATPLAPATTPATAPASNGGAVAAIKNAYTRFFNPATSLDQSVALLQNGPAFTETLRKQAKTDFAKATTATVSTVTVQSPTKATVVYSILLSGTPVLVDATGSAVHERGAWKVSGATFCGLLAAQGPAPRVCAQSAAPSASG